MSDPILKAAADLKSEIKDVKSPELDQVMDEIMALLMSCIVDDGNTKH